MARIHGGAGLSCGAVGGALPRKGSPSLVARDDARHRGLLGLTVGLWKDVRS